MPVYMPTPASQAGAPARQAIVSTARFGKRAYVRCTGQLVRGPLRVQVRTAAIIGGVERKHL